MHFALAAGMAGALALWPLWFVVGRRPGEGAVAQYALLVCVTFDPAAQFTRSTGE
jgi:hypothetical protein